MSVNSQAETLEVEPRRTLLQVLREDLELTGTKEGCDEGACGACTVLVDGEPHLACLTLAVTVEGRSVTTIEGLAQGGVLSSVQEAFIRHGAIQCGFCTPGAILSAEGLLRSVPRPTEEEVKRALSGNLCRCTGYVRMVQAVLAAAERKGQRSSSRGG
ncbi:MAG: (2Fe-2S)-binding protein [Candidatus Tectomicrobia bacterium]|nr:(2Fe-2S)-binding protein [Candidatus Tectomicrobia bacterium]